MKKSNPALQVFCAAVGAGIALVVSHFYGMKVVLISILVLFAFLIGIAKWYKHKNKP